MYSNSLSDEEARRALDAFQQGIVLLHQAETGDKLAALRAVVAFLKCLEWATPQTFPQLYQEAMVALAQARYWCSLW